MSNVFDIVICMMVKKKPGWLVVNRDEEIVGRIVDLVDEAT